MTLNIIIIDLPYAGAVFAKTGQEGFFWCDSYNIEDYGPFPTVYAAMEDYTEVVKARLASKVIFEDIPPIINNVISIDFKNKSRLG